MSEKLTLPEFTKRFVDRMCKLAPFDKFEDGQTVASYAEDTAKIYWEDQHQDGETPEDCADSDMDYWGE